MDDTSCGHIFIKIFRNLCQGVYSASLIFRELVYYVSLHSKMTRYFLDGVLIALQFLNDLLQFTKRKIFFLAVLQP